MIAKRYIGEVISVPTAMKFAWIGIGTVIQEDGSQNDLSTKDDVYAHLDQSELPAFKVGMKVSFYAVADEERKKAFRAVSVREYAETELYTDPEQVVPGMLVVHTNPGSVILKTDRSFYRGVKQVPADTVAKVAENLPLQGLPRDDVQRVVEGRFGSFEELANAFLFNRFPHLQSLEMDYRVTDFDQQGMNKKIQEAVTLSKELGMARQAAEIQADYELYLATRLMLENILRHNLLGTDPANMTPEILNTVLCFVQALEEIKEDFLLLPKAQKALQFLLERNMLRQNSFIPLSLVPDLWAAFPVWYWFKNADDSLVPPEQPSRDSVSRDASKEPQTCLRNFCRLFPHTPWPDFFQLTNQFRSLRTYRGDHPPVSVLKLVAEAKDIFDDIIFMTPYLDVLLEDWASMSWVRMPDPIVCGVIRNFKVMVVLARFSGNGIWPLYSELVADHMNFLRTHQESIRALNRRGKIYWYNGNSLCSTENLGDDMARQVGRGLQAFENGCFFDFLKGVRRSNGELIQKP